jgi:hypothetical protein
VSGSFQEEDGMPTNKNLNERLYETALRRIANLEWSRFSSDRERLALAQRIAAEALKHAS